MLPCHKFQPQNFFFFPLISIALYSGVKYGVLHHHKYLAHPSMPLKNSNRGHHPNAEPSSRCSDPWEQDPALPLPRGHGCWGGWLPQAGDWTDTGTSPTAVREGKRSRDGLALFASGWSRARGLALPAGDAVVAWCTASAGALALTKVAEGINQGWISLSLVLDVIFSFERGPNYGCAIITLFLRPQ